MRIIGHIDMDAFFASIEERDNSRLRGMPIVVGSDPLGGRGRGVVSTANYAARAYGIRSALPISKAWQFSEAARRRGLPAATFMAVDMERYADVSHRVMEILRECLRKEASADAPIVIQQASVDEAYFDLSFLAAGTDNNPYDAARAMAQKIKNEIRSHEHLTASVGIGPNKLIAKIASDVQKPDGLTVVPESTAEDFLAPMSVRKIPGIGPKSEEQFKKLGIQTIGQARQLSKEQLKTMMGKSGIELYEKFRGRSDAPLVVEYIAKSIGRHETFPKDVPAGDRLKDRKFLEATLAELAEDVHRNFVADATHGDYAAFRKVTITVRFADFKTVTRTTTLDAPVAATDKKALQTLKFHALRLFMPFLDRRENPDRKSFRLLGVRVEDLK
jgi:DNA polymerase IV (DinB-like DNA polymerase)